MSDHDEGDRSQMQQNANSDDTFDSAGGANNSIIGKVKSRVSSILPNSLSKWFSPSTKSDSINGNLSGGVARRRRRIEVEAEEDDDAEEEEQAADHEPHQGEYNENILSRQHDDDNFDEDSQNSERDILAANALSLNTRRNLNTTNAVQQPPSKRSRLNLVVTNSRDSPSLPSRPIVASTPAVNSNIRSGISQSAAIQMGRNTSNRYTHLNLYGQDINKEPAYDFQSSSEKQIRHEPKNAELNAAENTAISFRRSLNIPSTSQATTERYTTAAASSNLRRQSLVTFKCDSPRTSSGIGNFKAAFPMRTSTTILEIDGVDGDDADDIIIEETPEDMAEEPTKYNGRPVTSSFMMSKRQKLINGIEVVGQTEFVNDAGNTHDNDSASESSEGGVVGGTTEMPHSTSTQGRKSGLFNMSSAHSRNGSRTSSFGNGLNFYTHLEGRKSLFAGGANGNTLNNSTLSLTSLNRRQFNASIYGSTSALSDSRLLNTFSPFYKGKTTYGGAAAYNRYAKGTGAGASAVRITPTLIRPTSSLSTLSSSSLSLTAAGAANTTTENSSAISSTAKRILDLINDFATPLSEAKKMASNLKANQQQLLHPQAKARLNDSDLQATRAIRLAQVRTPYTRPAVTLQPTMMTQVNGNTTASSILPPVRELQVPSMSQLLQMKKMQTNTERARQIATHNSPAVSSSFGEYTLPIIDNRGSDSQRQKHTNKIKNKVSSSVRITASKDAATEALTDIAPRPINLPNIAFPLMQSVPKIDIKLPTSSLGTISSSSTVKSIATDAAVSSNAIHAFNTNNSGALPKLPKLPITPTTNSYVGAMLRSSTKPSAPTNIVVESTTNFKFSAPLELKGLTTPTQNITPINGNYKFSPPTLVPDVSTGVNTTTSSPLTLKKQGAMVASPQLKTGSVLDALKQSFEKTPTVNTMSNSFGCQFKKSTTEWECDTCMIRNKEESSKCVACETPRHTTPIVAKNVPLATSLSSSSHSFGSQFKKSGNEWECDTCMIRNKQEAIKCVACETLRNCAAPLATTSTPITAAPIKNAFGDSFKPKANTWECATCLITNKNESNACVACETKKPGSSGNITAPAPTGGGTFRFGFAAAAAAAPIATATTDAGFKSLAAEQKASKWECEACMTRNEGTRVKCVCCEQAKPGTQSTSEDVPKFAFGSSAASKFSFGFGASTSKEEDLRKAAVVSTTAIISATRTTNRKTETTVAAPPSSGGFTFGIKPTAAIAASKDVADASKPTSNTVSGDTGFKFGINASIAASATSNATAGFTFGTKPAETAASKANTSSAPSVKFNLPTTIATRVSTTSEAAVKCNLPIETTTATIPPTTITADNMAANKLNTTPAPTFTFGNNVASSTTSSFKPGGGLSFGTSSNHLDSSKAAANTTAPNGGFAFKTSAAAAAVTTSNSDSAACLIKTPTFGAVTAPSKASSLTPSSATTTTTATSPTFGNFGSFAGQHENKASVSTTMPLFGGVSNSVVGVAPANASFVFGSATPSASVAAAATTSNISSITSASASTTSSWPKNSFVFGAAAAPNKNAAAASTGNDATKSVFGNFGTAAAINSTTAQPAPSIFGNSNMASSSISSAPIASTFGNASSSGTNIFGANSAPGATTIANANAASVSSTNPFSAPSGNATTPAPTFGSSPFGGSSSSTTAVAPTFGSTATTRLPTSTFGSFGSAAAATDGASAAKKSDQAFNFGAPTATAAAQSTSGGFHFGSGGPVAKPAFNFAPSNQPAFNFTGGSTEQPQTVQPFQFGATPSAPVFNFSGGAVEAAPNAPFQFNAGTAPASNNIFAPPAPTAGAQAGQQIRRKIRAPIRRLTPR